MALHFHRGSRTVWFWAVAAGIFLIWSTAHLAAQSSHSKPPAAPFQSSQDSIGTVEQRPSTIIPPPESLANLDDLPMLPSDQSASMRKPPQAIAHYQGKNSPGETIVLRAAGNEGQDCRVQWVQVGGPAVRLDHPTEPEAKFTVPNTEAPIDFLLVVANSSGIDSTGLSIPTKTVEATRDPQPVHADAGDDQLGLVGRQVNLSGYKSEPRGQIGYRWVQTGGPTVRLKIEDGYFYSFVPTVPGLYRFALVVAAGGRISLPDEVTVTVGSGTRGGIAGGEAATAESLPTQEIARGAILALRIGAAPAESLARTFDDTADRMDLYQTYNEAFTEMSRRLETVIPSEAAHRARWVERLFQPLTARVIEVMRSEGLDLRSSEGPSVPLNAAQRASLSDQFRLMAEGVRSAAVSR